MTAALVLIGGVLLTVIISLWIADRIILARDRDRAWIRDMFDNLPRN